jgi:hypothetical protein
MAFTRYQHPDEGTVTLSRSTRSPPSWWHACRVLDELQAKQTSSSLKRQPRQLLTIGTLGRYGYLIREWRGVRQLSDELEGSQGHVPSTIGKIVIHILVLVWSEVVLVRGLETLHLRGILGVGHSAQPA